MSLQARAIWRLREGVSDAMTTAGYAAWPHQITLAMYMGVSKNRGTPKWMIYNGNPIKIN